MSDTPQTDSRTFNRRAAIGLPQYVVPAEFARQLERENASQAKKIKELEEGLGITSQELQESMDNATDLAVTREEYEAMKLQVQQLREALEPFAKMASKWDAAKGKDAKHDEYATLAWFTVGDLRRAAKALEGGEK